MRAFVVLFMALGFAFNPLALASSKSTDPNLNEKMNTVGAYAEYVTRMSGSQADCGCEKNRTNRAMRDDSNPETQVIRRALGKEGTD